MTSQEAVDILRSTGAIVRLTMARHRDVEAVNNVKSGFVTAKMKRNLLGIPYSDVTL